MTTPAYGSSVSYVKAGSFYTVKANVYNWILNGTTLYRGRQYIMDLGQRRAPAENSLPACSVDIVELNGLQAYWDRLLAQ